uniref:Uncharacterized protein n=1 Tax=Amphimedon queenslandica TaxID=400682 RepID=A0A1X7SS70_AMPQE
MSQKESQVRESGAGMGLEGEEIVTDDTARHEARLSEKDVEGITELMLKKLKKGTPPTSIPGSLPEEGDPPVRILPPTPYGLYCYGI